MNCIKHLKKTLWLGIGGHFIVTFGLVCSSWGQTITNIPPTVAVVHPPNGAVYYTPINIPLLAQAADLDGRVTNVEFFANGMDLGTGMMLVLDPPGIGGVVGPVYFLLWSNVPPTNYTLTAVATDNGGASTTSAAVNISVLQGPPPPPTNVPPIVRITSPPNGAVFRAPVSIPLYAYAADWGGSVTSVEFFEDGNSLGLAHRLSVSPIAWGGSNFWTLVWSNAPLGTNMSLSAVATANNGLSNTSAPVLVSVFPSPPPPTNRPPLVGIVATDPLAIEGTNCWPWLGLTGSPTWTNWLGPTPICRFFTNCGPKNATFTVFRFGATNDELDVTYTIGGTATNGVEYVALPGEVTIPAGERRAEITVVPIDDGPPDINSTVVLRLTPGTNYLVGFPRAAGALILDSRMPHPNNEMLGGSSFNLTASGPDGAWYSVEYSSDLKNWTSVSTNQVINGTIDFIDPDAGSSAQRFYRAVPQAGPPPF
jgi:hypothetical protein